ERETNGILQEIDTAILVAHFSTKITKSVIKQEQDDDKELSEIKMNLKDNPYYSLTDEGILLYQDGKIPVKSVVIPNSLINDILFEYHDSESAGHLGFAKTMLRMKGMVWFK